MLSTSAQAKLTFSPVLKRPDLVAPSVSCAVKNWTNQDDAQEIKVAEIDPAFCAGEDLCRHYGINPQTGANCLIVEAKRGKDRTYCACLAPVGAKMDLGGVLRRHLGARLVSMAPLDYVLATTGMEYGSITAIGLPESWKIFMDASLADVAQLIIGGGLKKSKLQLPAKTLLALANASLLEGLSKKAD